jgi:N-methylhydantoinase A
MTAPTDRQTANGQSIRIGIDVGGTFTDLVLADDGGRLLGFTKVASTPPDPSVGVLRALEAAAARSGMGLETLLARCSSLIHGTTVATNTLLERKGARVGLLCTQGFRDTLAIRKGTRKYIWDIRSPNAPDLVRRYLRREVRERTAKDGTVEVPVDLESLQAQLNHLHRERVDAIAICFFNAFLNSENERAAVAHIRQTWPEVHVSASSAILPVMGEYARTATTVVNAYVGPQVAAYLGALQARLREAGFHSKMLVTASNGGVVDAEYCHQRPVVTILSGPASGAPAAALYAEYVQTSDLLLMDMGGTSCDVTAVRSGRPSVTDGLEIGGYDIAMRSVDIQTIGTGGGSVASVDMGGLLHVGPEGMGAEPGPASYAKGGKEATITDANLLLGRINPAGLLGGELPLDARLAADAIRDRVATPLGLSVCDGALGIVRVGNQNMVNALRRISILKGYDPRKFTLVAGGGAGPLHAAELARVLNVPSVYVPRFAPALCALGTLQADMRHDYVRTFLRDTAEAQGFAGACRDMLQEASEVLRGEGFGVHEMVFEQSADLRYRGQHWEVEVPFRWDEGDPSAGLVDRFHERHHALYGYSNPPGHVELVRLRLSAFGRTPKIQLAPLPRADSPVAPRGTRRVYQGREVWLDVPVYSGHDLEPGHQLEGPGLVDDEATTVYFQSRDELVVDALGNYVVTVRT